MTAAISATTTSGPRILLVEDEESIASAVVYALSREGFAVSWRGLGREGLALFREAGADLVILDVGLPDMSGLDVCRELKPSGVPVIFLTARNDEVDRVVGLELGGDDYVTKPFSPRELAARVRAVLRRVLPPEAPLPPPAAPGAVPASPPEQGTGSLFQVDRQRCHIAYQHVPLALTKYEYLLLLRLLEAPGQVLSRGQIMEQAWQSADTSLERSVDTHVKSLRAKLRQVDPEFDPIITHRGFGYSLQERKP
ncbi:two-component system response regulator CreB [Megalodesulfovibrio paquesii]